MRLPSIHCTISVNILLWWFTPTPGCARGGPRVAGSHRAARPAAGPRLHRGGAAAAEHAGAPGAHTRRGASNGALALGNKMLTDIRRFRGGSYRGCWVPTRIEVLAQGGTLHKGTALITRATAEAVLCSTVAGTPSHA